MARAPVPIGERIHVALDVDEEVNYSLLHNNRELLNTLTLTKLVEGPLRNIAVTVELFVGAASYPYRYTHLELGEVQLALASRVKIPLTANLPRSLRERVQSTVYVKVTCEDETVFEDTRRVTLIPVDEWLDDTAKNPWLPSFVLPRDPAILKIISSSRRYLIGIMDDPAAGFDGYQESVSQVDKQVQAIWTSLVNEYRFQYINPPPAYSQQTQRLRTPTEIVQSNSGTCIDLALLLASCLEYIGIYPVVVLLADHAFVGYWRSEGAHDHFVAVKTIPPTIPGVGSRAARAAALPYVDEYGWRLTKLNYAEVMAYVTAGYLVMLEATYLTAAKKFSEAQEQGRANLRNRKEFDSLLDIQVARTVSPPVTPLPIINE
jgi:transglutaminase-like putative cysteine protease